MLRSHSYAIRVGPSFLTQPQRGNPLVPQPAHDPAHELVETGSVGARGYRGAQQPPLGGVKVLCLIHHYMVVQRARGAQGALIDGQHRLAAIVKAGIPVKSVVTRGVARSAFTVMDTGRRRSGRDALALAGEENSTHLVAALKGLHLYLTAPESGWSGQSSAVSNDQLLGVLDEHPGMREAVNEGIPMNKPFRVTVTAAAVGWYATSQQRPDIDQQPWVDGLIAGAGLRVGDPRLTMRNTLLNMAAGKAYRKRDDSREHLLYYLKAWNAWVEGREMKLLRRSPGEKMPKISRYTAPPRFTEGA